MNARSAIILLCLTLFAYAPVIRGGFIWDDDDHVTNNLTLRTLEGLGRIWTDPQALPQYYPLTHTSFWIEHQLWGDTAAGYHIVNILLHAASAILLWRVLALLEIRATFLAACLFAIHPVQVESVAWISERKNILCGLFYFAAALMYLKSQKPWDRRYLAAFALLLAALLSKTVACSLPAALVLVIWWKRGRVTQKDWIGLVPMFVVGAAFAFFTVHWEREWVRAVGPEWDYSLVDRVLIAGRAVWFYASKLVLPVNLAFIYPKWTINPHQLWQWAFPVGVLVAIATLWFMRDRWGRGPCASTLFFIGTLVPALGFFNIYPMRYSFVADHFQYIACVGLLVLIAEGARRVSINYVILAPLLLLTLLRSAIFADSERLWRDTLAKNPNSWMVNLNLARALNDRGEKTEAWRLFARLVDIAPNQPESHWNYGVSLEAQGRDDEALAAYTEAIRLGGDPLPQVYYARGRLYLARDNLDAAAADFLEAIARRPDLAQAHLNLARVYAKQGRAAEAKQALDRAVQLDPSLRDSN